VAYATRYGSTREVAEAVTRGLLQSGVDATAAPAHGVRSLRGYDAVVLGTPIYLGAMEGAAMAFLSRFEGELAALPCALFALGPITAAPGGDAGAAGQLQAILGRYPWLTPVDAVVFGGRFAPARLRLLDRLLTLLPASPLHGLPASDNRDWQAIESWAVSLARRLGAREAAV
jgi:menaquinone-dependent protoporphyrinogen oxidase